MQRTLNLNPVFLDEAEIDKPRKRKLGIFLAIVAVFAAIISLAVLNQKRSPQVARVTTDSSADAVTAPPPPVETPAGAQSTAVSSPSSPGSAAAPAADVPAAVPAEPPAQPAPVHKSRPAVKHARVGVPETQPQAAPAPSVAPPQLAPVPMAAPAAPEPIPTSTTTTAPSSTTSAPPPASDTPPPPPPAF
jgi:cytoskeletal protein RodZ